MSIKLSFKKHPNISVTLIGASCYNEQGLLFRFTDDAGRTFKILFKDLKQFNDNFEDYDIIKES